MLIICVCLMGSRTLMQGTAPSRDQRTRNPRYRQPTGSHRQGPRSRVHAGLGGRPLGRWLGGHLGDLGGEEEEPVASAEGDRAYGTAEWMGRCLEELFVVGLYGIVSFLGDVCLVQYQTEMTGEKLPGEERADWLPRLCVNWVRFYTVLGSPAALGHASCCI